MDNKCKSVRTHDCYHIVNHETCYYNVNHECFPLFDPDELTLTVVVPSYSGGCLVHGCGCMSLPTSAFFTVSTELTFCLISCKRDDLIQFMLLNNNVNPAIAMIKHTVILNVLGFLICQNRTTTSGEYLVQLNCTHLRHSCRTPRPCNNICVVKRWPVLHILRFGNSCKFAIHCVGHGSQASLHPYREIAVSETCGLLRSMSVIVYVRNPRFRGLGI